VGAVDGWIALASGVGNLVAVVAIIALAWKWSSASDGRSKAEATILLRDADVAAAKNVAERQRTELEELRWRDAKERRDLIDDIEELRHAMEQCQTPDALRARLAGVLARARGPAPGGAAGG
jgi:hypothetical protein